ncbi:MAG: SHOCT domain-containing protein, partial [Ktedonobacteraceae bacterium]
GGAAYAAGHHSGGQQDAPPQDAPPQDAPPQDAPPQDAPAPQEAAAPAPAGLTDEGIAQLKQLGQLHESGILTDAEFEASKQKILGI